jgi:hypothetical protein
MAGERRILLGGAAADHEKGLHEPPYCDARSRPAKCCASRRNVCTAFGRRCSASPCDQKATSERHLHRRSTLRAERHRRRRTATGKVPLLDGRVPTPPAERQSRRRSRREDAGRSRIAETSATDPVDHAADRRLPLRYLEHAVDAGAEVAGWRTPLVCSDAHIPRRSERTSPTGCTTRQSVALTPATSAPARSCASCSFPPERN